MNYKLTLWIIVFAALILIFIVGKIRNSSCKDTKNTSIFDFSNSKPESQTNDIFSYSVCCSGPVLAPGEYVIVEFISESGTFSCFGNNSISQGMGGGRDGVARSKSIKYELPKAINAVWASYSDRKVYSITSITPYDTILALFKNPGEPYVASKNDDSSYKISSLDLCFFPNRKVGLYVKAGAKTILLDWFEKGIEVHDENILSSIYKRWGLNNIDEYFDVYYTDKFSNFESWRRYIKKHGSIEPLLEKYLKRYNYSLEFEFEDVNTSIDKVKSLYSNGEQHWSTPNFNQVFKTPSILKESLIEWNTTDYHYTCFMYFNEEEMLSVFDKAYGDDRTQQGVLNIKVCKDNNIFDISLNVGDKSIKLEKTEIRVFRDPIDNPNGDGTLIYKNYEGNHKNLFADDKNYVVD